MPSGSIKVVVVEDQTLVREGTISLLREDHSIEVVGQAEDAEEALSLCQELLPDVVLLDIRLRSGSGIEVARTLRRQGSTTKVLVLTAYDFEQYVDALVRAGVSGYLLKDSSASELITAIHRAHAGEGVLPGRIASAVLRRLADQPRTASRLPEDLTAREIEVLELMAEGCGNQEIARRLGISRRTVEAHVANILGKLGVTSRSEAVSEAIKLGYVHYMDTP